MRCHWMPHCYHCWISQADYLLCMLKETQISRVLLKRDKFQWRWDRCVLGKYNGFGDMRTYWRLRNDKTIFDKVREIFHTSLYKVLHSVSKSKKWRNSHAWRPYCVQLFAMRSGTQILETGPYPFKTQRKKAHKICDWHMLFGTYILVFDFLLKNYFQSDQSLYPFKKLTRLLSSHLVHLDDLNAASCICGAAPNSCGFSKLFHS